MDSKGWLNFVQMPAFETGWARLGLTDDDLRALEEIIMADPKRPPVMPGTGGVRKLRFAPQRWAAGKRGAVRVCYIDFDGAGIVVLLAAFAKSSQADLTPDQQRRIRGLVGEIEKYLRGKPRQARGKDA